MDTVTAALVQAMHPLGFASLSPLLRLLEEHPPDVPGSYARIAAALSVSGEQALEALDVDCIVMRVSAIMPGVFAPRKMPAVSTVAYPRLANGQPLLHCLACKQPLAWGRTERPFFYTERGCAGRGEVLLRECKGCSACDGATVEYHLSETVTTSADGKTKEHRAYPKEAVHPEWFETTQETVVSVKTFRLFEALLSRAAIPMEAFTNVLADFAGTISRFDDLSVADEVNKSKHTQRARLSPARFAEAYWRWAAVQFAQLHKPELLSVLDLGHGAEALDRMLEQVREPYFLWSLERGHEHGKRGKSGDPRCKVGCGLVYVFDGNGKLIRTKCITRGCSATPKNTHVRHCTDCRPDKGAAAAEEAPGSDDDGIDAEEDVQAGAATQSAQERAMAVARSEVAAAPQTRATAALAAALRDKRTFIAKSIMAEKKEGRRMLYLVHWEGYGPTFWTWEPTSSFLDKALLKEWKERRVPVEPDLTACRVCNSNTDPASMNICLLCHEGLHAGCMTPAQAQVTEGYICASCMQNPAIASDAEVPSGASKAAGAARAKATKEARLAGKTAEEQKAVGQAAYERSVGSWKTRSCTPRDPPSGPGHTSGVLAAICVCGFSFPWLEMIHAEGSNMVLEYMRVLFASRPEEDWPKVLAYDDMCHLLPCLRNHVRLRKDSFFAALDKRVKFCVDPFHFRTNHIGAWCRANVNPHKTEMPKGPNGEPPNMEICEQFFSRSNHYKWMARGENEARFNMLLLKIVELNNDRIDAELEHAAQVDAAVKAKAAAPAKAAKAAAQTAQR